MDLTQPSTLSMQNQTTHSGTSAFAISRDFVGIQEANDYSYKD